MNVDFVTRYKDKDNLPRARVCETRELKKQSKIQFRRYLT
jgi:hypothetical protein